MKLAKNLQKINDCINWFVEQLIDYSDDTLAEMQITEMLKRNKGKLSISKKAILDKYKALVKSNHEADGDAMNIPINFSNWSR